MGIPALYHNYMPSLLTFAFYCATSTPSSFFFFSCFFLPSFCSISAFSCLSSKHYQSTKYLRFTGKPKVIHSAESLFVQNDRFTWQCLNSQRKLLLAVWQACRDQVLSPCQTLNNMYLAGGDPPHLSQNPSSQTPLLCCWDWWRLFPLPDWPDLQISRVGMVLSPLVPS